MDSLVEDARQKVHVDCVIVLVLDVHDICEGHPALFDVVQPVLEAMFRRMSSFQL